MRLIDAERLPNDKFFEGCSDMEKAKIIGWMLQAPTVRNVIVLPCEIGDTLYYPSFGTNRVLLYKVISIKLNSKGLYVVCENCLSKSQMTHRATQIGETIFLTKIEAESALAERRNECEYIRCHKCRHSALTSTDGELYCFKENKIVRCEDSCGCAEGKIGQ